MKNVKKNILKPKILAFDMDGCLTKETCWTPKDCLNATPNMKVVELARKLDMGNIIIIYTARRDNLIPATLQWLRKHGVPFFAISNNKMYADVYIDDKAFNPVKNIEL